MVTTESLKQHITEQEYWNEQDGDKFTLNCGSPWDDATSDDRSPGSGNLAQVYVQDGKIHMEWAWNAGYDEHWEFDSVEEFARHYDTFLTEGIDGIN